MGSNKTISYNDNTDTHTILGLTSNDTSASYTHNDPHTRVNHTLENNNIAGHANNNGHNWINTRCTPGPSDNYTKGGLCQ